MSVVMEDIATELTHDEIEALKEEAEKARQIRLAALRALAEKLGKKRDEVVRQKRVIESRWIEDRRQYNGHSRIKTSKQYASTNESDLNNPPRIHATRARTDRWEARLSDMLLPQDDMPWDISPTPDAEVSDEIKQEEAAKIARAYNDAVNQAMSAAQQSGQSPEVISEPTAEDLSNAIQKAAEARCSRMRTVIRDQLAACKFVRSGRRMIRDACQLGTGLLMGPMPGTKVRRRFSAGPGGMQVEIEQTTIPEIREADPRFFFPDMVPTVDKAEFAWYLHLMSPREVQELNNFPDFDAEEIKALLKEDPSLGEVGVNITEWNRLSHDEVEPTTGRYAVWRYTGVLDKHEMEALQLDTCDCDGNELVPLPMVDMWLSGEHILMAQLQPIEKDYRIPYFVFSPFPADDTMFGYSFPYMCRDSQKTADIGHNISLHNASISSGPQTAIKKGKIEPADGSYLMRGPKVWYVKDEDAKLEDVISHQIIPNNSDQANEIVDRALNFLDMELNADQWADSEPNKVTDTASGLAMLMNAKSIIQRRAAACADDEIFIPVVERLYWWNMLYNEREDIKGDYDVIPKAQSVQLVKDVQAQQTLMFFGFAENPKYAGMVDDYEAFTTAASFFDFPGKDRVIVPRDKWEANSAKAPPQPAEVIAQAQARQAEANAAAAEAKAAVAQQPQEAPQGDGPAVASIDVAELQIKANMEAEKVRLEYAKLASAERVAQMRLEAEILQTSARLNLDADKTFALLNEKRQDREAKTAIEAQKVQFDQDELTYKAITGNSGI